jgi:hypothetical protein
MKTQSKYTALYLCLLLLSQPLFACNGEVAPTLQPNRISSHSLIVGADEKASSYCVTEQGILYMRYQKMQYYSFEANASIVLCNKPNCLHASDACSAWYRSLPDGGFGATGLALYGDYLYVVKAFDSKNTFDLLKLDLSGIAQEVVYSIKVGNYTPDSWKLSYIDSVYYIDDTAWITAFYQYTRVVELDGRESIDRSVSFQAIMGVSLQDGSCVYLNEFIELKQMGYAPKYRILQASNGYIVFEKTWNSLELLNESRFNEALQRGEYQQFRFADHPYYEYSTWHYNTNRIMFEISVYSTVKNSFEVFDGGECEHHFESTGETAGYYTTYLFSGLCDDLFIYEKPDRLSGKSSINTYNPSTGERLHLFDIDNGTLRGFAPSWSMWSSVVDRGVLYQRVLENNKAAIYLYSLDTGSSTKLHDDYLYVTFRLRGESENYFIGEPFNDHNISGYNPLYRIDKQDYPPSAVTP